jgi:hypothetical protein
VNLAHAIDLFAAAIKPMRPVRGGVRQVDLPKYKERVNKRLLKLLKEHQTGGITLKRFDVNVRAQLKLAYQDAFRMGTGKKKIDAKDGKWIEKVSKRQMKYFDGFINDLVDDVGTMPLEQRLSLYTGALDRMFWSGTVKRASRHTQFNWVVMPGDNCDDCQELEDGGPYYRDELPTVPGAGDTACLMNCKCQLIPVE